MGEDDAQGPERVRALPTWQISQLHTRSHRLLAERLGAEGFTGRQYRLLAAAAESGPASQAELARAAALDRSDVVAAVDALVHRALVVRAPDPEDRRRNVITPTREGRASLARLDALVAAVQDELLAELSDRDRGELERLLALLVPPARLSRGSGP